MRTFISIVCFICVFVGSTLYAEDITSYTLEIGESKRIPIDGINPFLADDGMVTLKDLGNGSVIITGTDFGTTELLFWKGEELSSLSIEIKTPEIIDNRESLPSIKPGSPFFIYSFANSSSYSDNFFYRSPNYYHALYGNFPQVFSGSSSIGVSVLQPEQPRDSKLTQATLRYNHGDWDMNFGSTSAGIANFVGGGFRGASFTGATLKLAQRNQNKNGRHQLLFGGGVSRESNLLDTNFEQQVYLARYSYLFSRKDSNNTFLRNDSIGLGFYSFKDNKSGEYQFGEVLEGSYHFTPHFSIETGVNQTKKTFASSISPAYFSNDLFTSVNYSYSHHGLRNFASDPSTSNEHSYSLSLQKAILNYQTFLGLNAAQTLVFPVDGSGKTDVITSGASLQKYFSLRRNYIIGYNFARARATNRNSLTHASFVGLHYPVSGHGNLGHSFSYSRQDSDATSQQFSLSNSFSIESHSLSYSVGAGGGVQLNQGQTTESAGASTSLQYQLRTFHTGLSLNYSRPNVSQNTNTSSATLFLNWNITPNHIFGMSNSSSYNFGKTSQFSGSFSLNLMSYFGPGIRRRPLSKTFGEKRNLVDIKGTVFLDENFSSFLDSTDQKLSGVVLVVDDKNELVTDENGNFSLMGIKPGSHRISMKKESLEQFDGNLEASQEIVFTTSSRDVTEIFLSVTPVRAKVFVSVLLDSNENGVADENDFPMQVYHLLVTPIGGEARYVNLLKTPFIGGIDRGKTSIALDPMFLPENADLITSYEQTINVTDYCNYYVTFLFKPIRSLLGEISTAASEQIPLNTITVSAGHARSSVSESGSFWLKNLSPGDYEITLKNLPTEYCVKDPKVLQLHVEEAAMIEERRITISKECGKPEAQETTEP